MLSEGRERGDRQEVSQERSQGDVRLQPQLVDGHPLPGPYHRLAQLQVRGEEGVGEGAHIGQGHPGREERAGGSDESEVPIAHVEAGDKVAQCEWSLDICAFGLSRPRDGMGASGSGPLGAHTYNPAALDLAGVRKRLIVSSRRSAETGRGQPLHLPRGHALPIRTPHALQERRVQDGAQGRGAGRALFHLRRVGSDALALDVPVPAGGGRLSGGGARAGGVGGEDGGGAGEGGEGGDRDGIARGAASADVVMGVHGSMGAGKCGGLEQTTT
ncbi:hypothetical protein ACHAWF_008306 [Thalassiosira exigua]